MPAEPDPVTVLRFTAALVVALASVDALAAACPPQAADRALPTCACAATPC
jgi:hypothetical protein